MSRAKKYFVLVPLLFFLINVCLRWIGIEINSLAGDEPFSVYFAQMSISDILRHLEPGNNPPLYEILLHFWEKAFGIDEVAVRIPSLIFTGITAAFLYKIGNEFFTKGTGITAAVLFTFSNYATYFSHEARVYALFGMLTCLSYYLYLRWLNDRYSLPVMLLYILINVALLYSHYFGIMVLGVQVVLALTLSYSEKKKLRIYLYSFMAVFAFFTPYLHIVAEQFLKTKSDGTWLQPPQGWPTIEYMLIQWVHSKVLVKIAITVILLGVFAILRQYKNINRNSLVVLSWFIIPFFGMFFLSYKIPMFHDRYLMHTFIGFVLLLAVASISILRMPFIKWIIPLFLIVALAFTSKRNIDNGRHTKEAIAKVQSIRDTDTRVVMYPKYRIFGYAYYFNRDRFEDYDAEYAYYNVLEGFKDENFYGINQHSEARLDSTVNKMIFIMTDGGPERELLQSFKNDFTQTDSFHFPEIINVYTFERLGTKSTL